MTSTRNGGPPGARYDESRGITPPPASTQQQLDHHLRRGQSSSAVGQRISATAGWSPR
jgi:hypothetical protein